MARKPRGSNKWEQPAVSDDVREVVRATLEKAGVELIPRMVVALACG
jgi:hypothetical protein